jgi:PHP family Zn ribbon phosphoesterase
MIADFHIHSKYARWCSKRLTVENIWKTAMVKWIDLIWTWDFTHPDRFKELREFLEEDWNWFLLPKKQFLKKRIDDLKNTFFVWNFWWKNKILEKLEKWLYPKFVIQTEINNVFERQIWNKKIKKARVHNCILIDSFQAAKKILNYLSQFWQVESDWRLAVRQDQRDTLYWLKSNFPQTIFFPAHIWTPYFWVLGSKFWFNSLKEAFGESYFLIDWVETGLSSDPIMNWINSEIDPFVIVSNSDAHSLENMGREWNVIEKVKITEDKFVIWENEENFTYKDLERIFKQRKYKLFKDNLLDFERQYLDELFKLNFRYELKYTIEFYPQEWKYFWDWHSKCDFSCTPEETNKRNWKCPICWKDLTI